MSNLDKRVAAIKIAGTGRMKDILQFRDAGADCWMDFVDVGLATTYTEAPIYRKAIYGLLNNVNSNKPDFIVAEAGGDLVEANVPSFISDASISKAISAIVIVPADIMAAIGAHSYLVKRGAKVPSFVSLPKMRNEYTSAMRLRKYLPMARVFDPLNAQSVKEVVNSITEIAI